MKSNWREGEKTATKPAKMEEKDRQNREKEKSKIGCKWDTSQGDEKEWWTSIQQ